jgi:hypothetical protein
MLYILLISLFITGAPQQARAEWSSGKKIASGVVIGVLGAGALLYYLGRKRKEEERISKLGVGASSLVLFAGLGIASKGGYDYWNDGGDGNGEKPKLWSRKKIDEFFEEKRKEILDVAFKSYNKRKKYNTSPVMFDWSREFEKEKQKFDDLIKRLHLDGKLSEKGPKRLLERFGDSGLRERFREIFLNGTLKKYVRDNLLENATSKKLEVGNIIVYGPVKIDGDIEFDTKLHIEWSTNNKEYSAKVHRIISGTELAHVGFNRIAIVGVVLDHDHDDSEEKRFFYLVDLGDDGFWLEETKDKDAIHGPRDDDESDYEDCSDYEDG